MSIVISVAAGSLPVGATHFALAEQPKAAAEQATPSAAARQSLQTAAQAEYQFAQDAQKNGTRAAFLQWFANDGRMCAPDVVNAIETVTKWPESKDSLVWYPSQSYTATSGDLGYTLGPWTFRSADGKQVVDGTVLSVWRKEPNGAWRVVLDCGTHHPKPAVAAKKFDLSAVVPIEKLVTPAAEWIEPVARAESLFADAVAQSGLPSALKEFATKDVRVLYTDSQTAETLESASTLLKQRPVGKTFLHVYTDQALDGTLGYAWGYVGNAKAAKPTALYANVWRKTSMSSPWKIVAQVYQLLPEPKK